MDYTIIVNGRSYMLPKKTVSVMEALDKVLQVDSLKGLSVRQRFEKLHEFIKDSVGAENAKEMFGSDNLDEIDLSELTVTIKRIVDAYDAPVVEYDNEKTRNRLNSLPIDKIISMASATKDFASLTQKN